MYKKARKLAAGGSDSDEEIEFTRHISPETPPALAQLAAINQAQSILWCCFGGPERKAEIAPFCLLMTYE